MDSTRIDRRKKYSLRMIRQAFLELLTEKDMDSITVTEICNLADINRGTFYKYYSDIYDLFQQTCDAFLNELYNIIMISTDANDNKDRSINEMLNDALGIVSQNTDLLIILIKTKNFNVIVPKIITLLMPLMLDRLRNLYPMIPENEMNYLAEFICGGCGAIARQWLDDGMTVSKEEISNMMYKNIIGVLEAYRR